jgi:hypothetical protein
MGRINEHFHFKWSLSLSVEGGFFSVKKPLCRLVPAESGSGNAMPPHSTS